MNAWPAPTGDAADLEDLGALYDPRSAGYAAQLAYVSRHRQVRSLLAAVSSYDDDLMAGYVELPTIAYDGRGGFELSWCNATATFNRRGRCQTVAYTAFETGRWPLNVVSATEGPLRVTRGEDGALTVTCFRPRGRDWGRLEIVVHA